MPPRFPLASYVVLAFALALPAHAALPAPAPRAASRATLHRHLAPHVPVTARVRPGVVLALLDADARVVPMADGRLAGLRPDVAALLARHALVARAIGAPATPGGLRALRLESVDPGFDPRAVAAELRASGAFRAVAPDLVLDPFVIPNDADVDLQWAISNPSGPDVSLPAAWDVGKGDTSTVIAIMDNGVDVGHPDLASQLWINRGEIPGNGIDDDHDGWVDDVNGYDFGDGNADPSSQPEIDASGIDEGFHGTFVAGIASAANDNTEGIAGAAWKCRIMALKVADSTAGGITLEAVTGAFAFLDAHPASVLNMSFGTTDTTARAYFQALVDDADAHNVLCVAAAGNDGDDSLSFPAGCARVVSVGSIDDTGARSSFSQYGAWVSVSAPGEAIWSAISRNYDFDELSQIIYLLFFGWDGESPYMYGDGTSFASPLVSGIAGLVRTKYPSLTTAQVRARLIATGDVVAYDQPLGPRVNAYRALTDPLVGVGDPQPRALADGIVSIWPQPALATSSIRFALASPGHARLEVVDVAGRNVRVLADQAFAAGPRTVSWDGLDAHGHAAAAGIYFARLITTRGADTKRLVRVR